MYFPVDLSHIAPEVVGKKLSKATIELLAVLRDRFLNPVVELARNASDPFSSCWDSRYAKLVPRLLSPPDTRKRPLLDMMKHLATPKPAKVKGKTKVSTLSKTSKPKVQMVHKCYKTRSSRLISRFSNTTSNPITIDNNASTGSDLEAQEGNLGVAIEHTATRWVEIPHQLTPQGFTGRESRCEHTASNPQGSEKHPESSSCGHDDVALHYISSTGPLLKAGQASAYRGERPMADFSFTDDTASGASGLHICTPSTEFLFMLGPHFSISLTSAHISLGSHKDCPCCLPLPFSERILNLRPLNLVKY